MISIRHKIIPPHTVQFPSAKQAPAKDHRQVQQVNKTLSFINVKDEEEEEEEEEEERRRRRRRRRRRSCVFI